MPPSCSRMTRSQIRQHGFQVRFAIPLAKSHRRRCPPLESGDWHWCLNSGGTLLRTGADGLFAGHSTAGVLESGRNCRRSKCESVSVMNSTAVTGNGLPVPLKVLQSPNKTVTEPSCPGLSLGVQVSGAPKLTCAWYTISSPIPYRAPTTYLEGTHRIGGGEEVADGAGD